MSERRNNISMKRTTVLLGLGLMLLATQPLWAQGSPNADWGAVPAGGRVSVALFPCPGDTFDLTFDDAGDAFVFELTPTSNGSVKVYTSDGFLFGPDIWRAALHQVKANGSGKSKAGTGTVDDFTGKISLGVKTGRTYQVVVTADDVPAGFPGGMSVCIDGPVDITGPLAE